MKKRFLLFLPVLLLGISCNRGGKSDKETKTDLQAVGVETPQANGLSTSPMNVLGPGKDDGENSVATLFMRGTTLFKSDRFEEGISYFNRVLESDPGNNLAYYNIGYGYYSLKEYEKAISSFSKALELNPSDSASQMYIGLIHYYKAEYPESIEAYNRAISIYPKYATAFYNRGLAYGQMKVYDKAIADFDRATELKKDYPDAYYNRGLARFLSGDREGACDDWEQAKSLGSFSASEAIGYYCMGRDN